ncbi:PilZ domain-containing protein [bacterium]|nr:PilZ domain-containing protein [bacterium]
MSGETKETGRDRRIKERHPSPDLKVQLRKRGLFGWSRHPVTVQCIDVNRYGMSIVTDMPIGLKDAVMLDLKGEDITESNIVGVVSSAYGRKEARRLGITFKYWTDKKAYSRDIDNALSRVEAIYNPDYKK